jgi:hypothetical protein
VPTVPAGREAVEIVRAAVAGLIVKENTFVAVAEAPSVTRTVKVGVGTTVAAVGVPLRTPAVDRARPAGSVPADTAQVFVPVPPVDANVSGVYAVPTVPAVSGLAVEIVRAAVAGLIVKENTFVAVAEAPSVTWTVKVGVGTAVAAVGVPLRTPAVDRARPAGSVPADTAQVFVPVPPVDANVSGVYAVPTVPAVSGLAVEIVRAAVAVIEKRFVDTLCSPWFAFVGLPESYRFPNQATW